MPTSPSSVYTVIVPTEGEVDQPTRFTLTALAIDRNSVRFEDPPPDLPYASHIEGSWVGRTAGGSPSFPSFMNNPMYQLVLRPPPGGELTTGDLRVTVNVKKVNGVLDGGASTVGVNVKLVWGKGERITKCVSQIHSIKGRQVLTLFFNTVLFDRTSCWTRDPIGEI